MRGSKYLVHAGDIGSDAILAALWAVAPVTALRGNNDRAPWATSVPLLNTLSVGDVRIRVVHDLPHLEGRALPDGTRAVVYGHSHRPSIDLRDGVLYINPGSAGPRRFNLPVTVALLRVSGSELTAEIVSLEH